MIESGTKEDFQRAAELDPQQWRYDVMLAQYYLQHTNPANAEKIAGAGERRFPGNGSLIRLYAECLIATRQYQAGADLLTSANLLPAEGATQGHSLYREAYLQLSVEQMKAGHFRQALDLIARARKWPENLGSGQPCPIDIDDRLEDWLTFQCYRGPGQQNEAQQTLKILALQLRPKTGDLNNATPRPLQETDTGSIIHALALKEFGRDDEAQQLLAEWRKDDPDSELAKWGQKVLAGQSAALPSGQDDDARILATWLDDYASDSQNQSLHKRWKVIYLRHIVRASCSLKSV